MKWSNSEQSALESPAEKSSWVHVVKHVAQGPSQAAWGIILAMRHRYVVYVQFIEDANFWNDMGCISVHQDDIVMVWNTRYAMYVLGHGMRAGWYLEV